MMHPFLIAVVVALAQSQSTNPKVETGADKAQFERWQQYYRRVAAEYDMEQGKALPTRLMLRPEPVLSYTNPAGGGRGHGAMFVWTRDGRPEILARSGRGSQAWSATSSMRCIRSLWNR